MTEQDKETVKPETDADKVYDWWEKVRKGPGTMAALRRCRRPIDAAMVPAALSLLRRLPHWRPDRVMVLAAVLGHVKEHDGERRIAQRIGRASFDDEVSALLSEGRFRRLIQADGDSELLAAMTRLMRFMKHKTNVRDLADTLKFWNDRTRRSWTFDYYAVGIADPDARDPAADGAEPTQTPSQ